MASGYSSGRVAGARPELLPPPARHYAKDAARLGDSWLVGDAARVANAVGAADVDAAAAMAAAAGPGTLKDAGGAGLSYRAPASPLRKRPVRSELRPPHRELDVVHTLEALRHLRRDAGLFKDFSLDDLEDFAEICAPLSFERSQELFGRGELAVWFGVLLSGQAVAYLPVRDAGKDDILLGTHGAGELVGTTRASLWERSHVRPYSLKASEAGYLAVLTYDQLESIQRARPPLYLALLRALLAELTDAAGGFFRGCPLSSGTRWPIVAFHERRILDLLLKLREEGRLFTGVDYRALLALACRLRVTQWQARSTVCARGAPPSGALLVLDGKLTGFREAGGAPTAWFEAGDAVGLEGVLGGCRPCAMDVFAARPTLAALLLPEDLEDLGREFPTFAGQIVRSLHAKLFSELADPHGPAMLLLAEASSRAHFPPGESPVLAPGLQLQVGGLAQDDMRRALELAEATTALPSRRGPAGSGAAAAASGGAASFVVSHADDAMLRDLMLGPKARGDDAVLRDLMMGPQAARDDATLQSLLMTSAVGMVGGGRPDFQMDPHHASSWLLGGFFTQKLLARQAARAERAHDVRKAVQTGTSGTGRPASPPAPHRFGALPAERPRASMSDLVKAAGGLDVTVSQSDPLAAAAPPTTAFRQVLTAARGTARAREMSRRGLGAPNQPWALRRASSEPPEMRRHRSSSPLERSRRGASGFVLRSRPGAQEAVCPTCGGDVAPGLPFGRHASRLAAAAESAVPGGERDELWRSLLRGGEELDMPQRRRGNRSRVGEASELLGSAIQAMPGPAEPAKENDLWWYFEQQRRFLFDLRSSTVSPEESVAADQHQAWNLKVIAQQHDIEVLQARVKELEADKTRMNDELASVLKERDEWKASTLRMQLNREFKTTVESLNSEDKRFLRPAAQASAMPDFEQSLKQQLQIMETGGPVRHQEAAGQPPPSLRTWPRASSRWLSQSDGAF